MTLPLQRTVTLGLFLSLPVERLLTFSVAGFSIRPVYFFMLLFCLINYRFAVTGLRRMWPLLFVVAALTISAVSTVDWRLTAGYSLWALFTIGFACCAVGYLVAYPDQVARWRDAYIWSALVWSWVAIAQWLASLAVHSLAYAWIGGLPRVNALTYESSYLAIYLLAPLALAVSGRRTVAVLSITAALLCSTSRTGLLGLAVVWLALVVSGGPVIRARMLKTLVITAYVVGLMAFLPPVRQMMASFWHFTMSGVTLQDATSALPRLDSWLMAWNVFLQHPLTGVGPGAYGVALHDMGMKLHVSAHDLKTTNLWVEVAAELGLPGLLSLALWAFAPVVGLLRSREPLARGTWAMILGLVAVFALMQTWWRPYLWMPWIMAYALMAQRRTAPTPLAPAAFEAGATKGGRLGPARRSLGEPSPDGSV